MPNEMVAAAVLAEWLGVSKRSIAEFAAAGTVIKTARGRYDLKASIHKHTAHLREVAAARGGETAILDLTQERARLAREQADGQELKNKVTRGALVPADDVAREWAGILRDVRAAMLAVPVRIHQKIPHLDHAEVASVDREIRDALEALADDIDRTAPDGDGVTTPAAAAATLDMDREGNPTP